MEIEESVLESFRLLREHVAEGHREECAVCAESAELLGEAYLFWATSGTAHSNAENPGVEMVISTNRALLAHLEKRHAHCDRCIATAAAYLLALSRFWTEERGVYEKKDRSQGKQKSATDGRPKGGKLFGA